MSNEYSFEWLNNYMSETSETEKKETSIQYIEVSFFFFIIRKKHHPPN